MLIKNFSCYRVHWTNFSVCRVVTTSVNISSVNRASQCMPNLPVQNELCSAYQVRSWCDASSVLTELLNVNQVIYFIPSSQWEHWPSYVVWIKWFSLYVEFHNIHWVTSANHVQDYLEVISLDQASTSTECMTMQALIVDAEH